MVALYFPNLFRYLGLLSSEVLKFVYLSRWFASNSLFLKVAVSLFFLILLRKLQIIVIFVINTTLKCFRAR
jgi:hypothetical protein